MNKSIINDVSPVYSLTMTCVFRFYPKHQAKEAIPHLQDMTYLTGSWFFFFFRSFNLSQNQVKISHGQVNKNVAILHDINVQQQKNDTKSSSNNEKKTYKFPECKILRTKYKKSSIH